MPYVVNWNGRPLPPMRVPLNSLGFGDWPPQISPGAPEEGLYDMLSPTSGFSLDAMTGTQKLLLLGGAAVVAYLLLGRKKSSSSLVGRSIRIKSLA